MSSQDDRSRLLELLRREALLTGNFVLSSGRQSSWYLDCRRATLHPEGAVLCGSLLLDRVSALSLAPDCVGGPTLAADPLVSAMVVLSWQRGRGLPGFLVRKEAKGHGTQRLLEGQYQRGWKAVLVEDTVTTGGSLLKAVKAAEGEGMEVVGVLALVDREEGGREAFAGYRYDALFRVSELLA
jgi:orotate phosphoribosyltransferase